ncbi:MAG: hypothetical protein NTW05_07060, partial [Pseudonocardiales bacterium]|nr:hypothetical protein [Pseudonocardiales bacterium]
GLVAVLARVAGRGAGTAPRVGPVAAAVADALAAAAVAWLLLLVFPVVYEDVVDVVPLVVVGALVAGALRWLLTRTWTSVAPALLVAALGAVLTVGMSAAAEPFGDAAVDVPLVLALVCAGLALLLLLPAAARAWGAATRA